MGPSVDQVIWMISTVHVELVGLANGAISARLMGSAQRTRASLASVLKQNAEMASLVNVHPTVLDRCVSMSNTHCVRARTLAGHMANARTCRLMDQMLINVIVAMGGRGNTVIKKLTIVHRTRVSMAPNVSMETIIMNVDVSPDLMGPNVVTISTSVPRTHVPSGQHVSTVLIRFDVNVQRVEPGTCVSN